MFKKPVLQSRIPLCGTLVFLAFLFVGVFKPAYAQIPGIKFPCDDVASPEFHSLRPYQAAVCGDANKALFCSNDLIFIEGFNVAYEGGCQPRGRPGDFTCNPDHNVPSHDLKVQLDDSELPILGNTELVKNSQSNAESLDDATKMNEYVSWYLNGVNNRAEYGTNKNTANEIVNFSGPIQKLLPGIIQDAQRIKTIENAVTQVAPDNENEPNPSTQTEPANHNQVVVCGTSSLGWFGDIFNIGRITPVPCYGGDEKFRLNNQKGDEGWYSGGLSAWNNLVNKIGDEIIKILPSVPADIIRKSVLEHWNSRLPPLPWEDDPFEKGPMTALKYRKYYNEWRGKTCVIVPLINFIICFDNILVPNKWADLFPFVPLANTVDKKGAEYLYTDPQIKPSGQTEITNERYGTIRNAPLYFAHSLEDKELSETLNKTYTPQGFQSVPLPDTTEKNEWYDCRVVNVRANPGDDLFPGDPDEIQVQDVSYKIILAECHETITTRYDNKCQCIVTVDKLTCPAEVRITLKTNTKSPYAEDIWKATVADSGSTFRKIYPKVSANAPVSCIANIPTETGVTYTPTNTLQAGGSWEFKVKPPGGGTTDNPKLYFPFIGSVYDYFLKGIQQALRPKGYGEGTPESGQYCAKSVQCGELPDLPKASGLCGLGSTSSRTGNVPQGLKDIISAAAETYKVPPNLILGIMFGEGAFNTDVNGKYARYNWTDENVKNWATCQKLPNCSPGGATINSVVPFIGTYWDNLAKAILPDLQKIDPNKKEADPCNLLDATFALAKDLHTNAGGSPAFAGHSCFGIPLTSSSPTSCSWNDSQYETAIRVWEFGTEYNSTYMCATLENSCLLGGGAAANCPTGDDCETINNRYPDASHNGCLWDVAHGN